MKMRRFPTAAACMAILAFAPANAEQMQRFGDWEVHYIVLPSGFLKPDVAAGYGLVRGRDRAFINVSVLDPENRPATATIRGDITNLLGQRQELTFREIAEGGGVYYLGDIKHSNEEVLRFKIRITPPGESEMLLEFQQKLYWEEP